MLSVGALYLYNRWNSKRTKKLNRELAVQFYFKEAQQTSDVTVQAFLPLLTKQLKQFTNVNNTLTLLQQPNLPRNKKLELWDKLKLQAFTQTVTAVYGLCLLVLFLRIQVNIVSRYLFEDSCNSMKQNQHKHMLKDGDAVVPTMTEATQQKFLRYAEYILEDGLKDLTLYVQEKVGEIVSQWPLQKSCSFEEAMEMIYDIRKRVEQWDEGSETKTCIFSQFLLSPEKEDAKDYCLDQSIGAQIPSSKSTTDVDFALDEPSKVRLLINETRNSLESPRFKQVTRTCLDSAFELLKKNLQKSFVNSQNQPHLTLKPPTTKLVMAKLVPAINKQLNAILQTENNEIVGALSRFKELNDYSYFIFHESLEGLDYHS